MVYDPCTKEIVGGVTAANVINNYFADIDENLAKKLPTTLMEF